MTFRRNLGGVTESQSADQVISMVNKNSSCLMNILGFNTAKSFSQDSNKCLIYSKSNGKFVIEDSGLIF